MRVPASRSRTVTPSSAGATYPRRAALPASKGCPATMLRSLTGTGTPRKGGRSPPSRSRRVASAACSRASSGVRWAKAPTEGPRRSARSRVCSTTSSGQTSPARTVAARSRALSSWMSLIRRGYRGLPAEDRRHPGERYGQQRSATGEMTERPVRRDLPARPQGLDPGLDAVAGDDGAPLLTLRRHHRHREPGQHLAPDDRGQARHRPVLGSHLRPEQPRPVAPGDRAALLRDPPQRAAAGDRGVARHPDLRDREAQPEPAGGPGEDCRDELVVAEGAPRRVVDERQTGDDVAADPYRPVPRRQRLQARHRVLRDAEHRAQRTAVEQPGRGRVGGGGRVVGHTTIVAVELADGEPPGSDPRSPVAGPAGRAHCLPTAPRPAAGQKGARTMGIGDKAKDALSGDKGEQASDAGLDRASDLADDKTGGKHSDKIDKGRDAADKKLGNE